MSFASDNADLQLALQHDLARLSQELHDKSITS